MPDTMKRRIDPGFVLAFSIIAFSSCSAFYLPGLAPVSFCEVSEADDCQVKSHFHIVFCLLQIGCCTMFVNVAS